MGGGARRSSGRCATEMNVCRRINLYFKVLNSADEIYECRPNFAETSSGATLTSPLSRFFISFRRDDGTFAARELRIVPHFRIYRSLHGCSGRNKLFTSRLLYVTGYKTRLNFLRRGFFRSLVPVGERERCISSAHPPDQGSFCTPPSASPFAASN